jgi:hypothetical protein
MTEMGSVGMLGGPLAARWRCRFVRRPSAIELVWAAPDDLRGKGRLTDAVDLLGTLARF